MEEGILRRGATELIREVRECDKIKVDIAGLAITAYKSPYPYSVVVDPTQAAWGLDRKYTNKSRKFDLAVINAMALRANERRVKYNITGEGEGPYGVLSFPEVSKWGPLPTNPILDDYVAFDTTREKVSNYTWVYESGWCPADDLEQPEYGSDEEDVSIDAAIDNLQQRRGSSPLNEDDYQYYGPDGVAYPFKRAPLQAMEQVRAAAAHTRNKGKARASVYDEDPIEEVDETEATDAQSVEDEIEMYSDGWEEASTGNTDNLERDCAW